MVKWLRVCLEEMILRVEEYPAYYLFARGLRTEGRSQTREYMFS